MKTVESILNEKQYTKAQILRAWKLYRKRMRAQKLIAFLFFIISIATAFVDGDCTFAVFGGLISLYVMTTSRYLG